MLFFFLPIADDGSNQLDNYFQYYETHFNKMHSAQKYESLKENYILHCVLAFRFSRRELHRQTPIEYTNNIIFMTKLLETEDVWVGIVCNLH